MPLHSSTLLARTPASLQNQIRAIYDTYANKGHTFLFALSANFPASDDLLNTVEQLTQSNTKRNGHTLGCLSDPLPSSLFQSSHCDPVLSCSIAIFDTALSVPFRSDIPGRTQTQVGRWHSFRKKEDNDKGELEMDEGGNTPWEDIWNRAGSSASSSSTPLPEALRSLDPNHIDSLIFLSDLHPEGLCQSLHTLPRTRKLGLIAASTHFITARPVTLFQNTSIFGEGALGLALLTDGKKNQQASTSHVYFQGVRKLADPMTVTSREGNMINTLNASNPTQLLLSAIRSGGISTQASPISKGDTLKDTEEFALGLLSPTGEITRTYRITAGDPSSRGGALSLDADMAPQEGTVAQFLHRPSSFPLHIPATLLPSTSTEILPSQTSEPDSKQTIAFLTIPEPSSSPLPSSSNSSETETLPLILPNTFLAPSLNGFIVSQPTSAVSHSGEETTSPSDSKISTTWKCTLPGGLGSIEWV
ncbi:hypothetical protein B0H34DRAFT_657786 [Crassisporium funariophilum]|nr:hypothetical protein B0H34DRAFT_657786 [Crassisporium funariophilum]